MLSRIAKLLLTSTAIAPVALAYAWVAYVDGKMALMWMLLAGCGILFATMHGLLAYCRKNLEKSAFRVTTIEAADRENIAFLLLYILPLFGTQFSNLNWQIGRAHV